MNKVWRWTNQWQSIISRPDFSLEISDEFFFIWPSRFSIWNFVEIRRISSLICLHLKNPSFTMKSAFWNFNKSKQKFFMFFFDLRSIFSGEFLERHWNLFRFDFLRWFVSTRNFRFPKEKQKTTKVIQFFLNWCTTSTSICTWKMQTKSRTS